VATHETPIVPDSTGDSDWAAERKAVRLAGTRRRIEIMDTHVSSAIDGLKSAARAGDDAVREAGESGEMLTLVVTLSDQLYRLADTARDIQQVLAQLHQLVRGVPS
jgi:hypothetical protein